MTSFRPLTTLLGFSLVLTLACGGGAPPPPAEEAAPAPVTPAEGADIAGPVVEMRTSLGTMKVELYPEQAPVTVENFLRYVREGFYDGTIFHRVVKGFVIQGGGFTTGMEEKENHAPIENEATNGLRNLRGTLSMARTSEPHSATSQFFINTKDNPPLDHRDTSVRGWGYAVFGKVVEGLEVVDAIERVQTTSRAGHDDVPAEPVVIESVRIAN